jgi:hypothetical protein
MNTIMLISEAERFLLAGSRPRSSGRKISSWNACTRVRLLSNSSLAIMSPAGPARQRCAQFVLAHDQRAPPRAALQRRAKTVLLGRHGARHSPSRRQPGVRSTNHVRGEIASGLRKTKRPTPPFPVLRITTAARGYACICLLSTHGGAIERRGLTS